MINLKTYNVRFIEGKEQSIKVTATSEEAALRLARLQTGVKSAAVIIEVI